MTKEEFTLKLLLMGYSVEFREGWYTIHAIYTDTVKVSLSRDTTGTFDVTTNAFEEAVITLEEIINYLSRKP